MNKKSRLYWVVAMLVLMFSTSVSASQNAEYGTFRLGEPNNASKVDLVKPDLLLAQSSSPSAGSTPAAFKNQTSEWEARTLRSLATGELFIGGSMVLGALASLSSSPLGAIVLGAVGGIYSYYGYTNLLAAQRFFHPDPLLSDSDETFQDEKVFSVSYVVGF